ncbi:hypothetical protein D3C73_718280 [compost metagenome]
MDFDSIYTRSFGYVGCKNKFPHQFFYLLGRQLPGHFSDCRGHHRTWSNDLPAADQPPVVLPARMLELEKYFAVMTMDRPGQLLQPRNKQQIACVQLVRCAHPCLIVHPGNFSNDQAAASRCTLLIESNHFIRSFSAGRSQGCAHSRHDNPVLKLKAANFPCGHQFLVFHLLSTSTISVSPPKLCEYMNKSQKSLLSSALCTMIKKTPQKG